MQLSKKRLLTLCWLLVGCLVLGAADDAFAGKKKKKKKKKKKRDKAEVTESVDSTTTSAAPAPPKVVGKVQTRLLAYDTQAARDLLAGETIDSNVHLAIADGRVLDQEAKYSKAIDRLAAAVEMASDDPAPLVYLGEAHLRAGSTSAANDAFARAEQRAKALLGSSASDATTLYYLGVAQQRQKRFGEAIATLEQARDESPRDPLVVYQIGATHAFQRDWSEAIDALTASIELDPGIAYAYYYRGLAAGEAGRKDLLVNDLDRFLAMAPNAPEAEQARRLLGGL